MNFSELIAQAPPAMAAPCFEKIMFEQIKSSLYVYLAIGMIMWIIEPALKKTVFDKIKFENKYLAYFFEGDTIWFLYKWIGLGILFIVGFRIFMYT